ncbi:MAG: hypothetical protein QOD77_2316 [Thermoplasmata archaeon]|jgi:hypothetical protein|nr:hypothetical protein [Thermoplasmata archaeon]
MSQKVADVRANPNENIVHAAKVIGRSKVRRAVFEAIYRGKKKVKTVDEVMATTGFSRKQVLNEGKKLAGNQIVSQVKVNGLTGYEKDEFFVHTKSKVLGIVDNPSKGSRYPTKQEPRTQHAGAVIKLQVGRSLPLPTLVTIDDVGAFAAVKKHPVATGEGLSDLPEARVKNFLQKVIGETHEFKDWGGEKNDLYTNKLFFRGKRYHAAFALKGKATSGPLTPKKMGKNGDQLGRLFSSEAQVFFVVYHSKIEESVVQQMTAFAVGRALSGIRIYYGTIDGDDLARLIAAYPKEFAASALAS